MLIKQGVLCKLVIRVNSISAYGIFREQKTPWKKRRRREEGRRSGKVNRDGDSEVK
tara:strand:+ start:401 stop:568 length:168 start_codon:yes stop_codon:yes gene_type:complete